MTDLIIYNRSLIAQGIIDLTTSILWERRFYEAGYFEIHVPMNDNSIALLQKDNYLMRSDSVETGVIIYLRKKSDGKGKDEITVIGRFLSYLMHGHVIQQDTTLSGNVETIMRSLVNSTVITPANDRIPNLQLGELCGTSKTVTYAVKYGDLHDTLRDLSQIAGVGFRIRLDPNNAVMYFECYEPTDHSIEQSRNPAVIFSPDYDTTYGGAEYVEDDTKTVNAVISRYSGEYGTVVVDYNPTSVTGLDKHQIAIEGRPVTFRNEDHEYELDENATRAKLLEAAKKKIVKKTKKLSVPVTTAGSFIYKTDYDIGDIVTLKYAPFGVDMTRRIHKISENYTQSSVDIIPDMGEPYPADETTEEENEE